MTEAEIITLSEITGQSISAVEGAVTGISAALETKLQGEIATWNTNRNKVKTWIDKGKNGVNVQTRSLLDAITNRVCVWLGFPLPADKFYSQLPGSMVVSTELGW